MRRRLVALAVAALTFLPFTAEAQQTRVVADCASTGLSWAVDNLGRPLTINQNGILCTNAAGGGGGGAGTEYTEDAAAPANPTAGAVVFRRKDALSASEVSADGDWIVGQSNAKGEQYVKDADLLTAVNSPIPAQTGIGNVNIGAVQSAGSAYETVAASQTAQVLGATGATGDYLSHCVIYPATTSPGVVTVFDNANAATTNVIAFPGGATSTSNLVPFALPVGAISTAGAWKVTTGANVSVTCYGKFT